MKTALLIGGGSKFGLMLSDKLLEQGWKVITISGSSLQTEHKNLTHLEINWKELNVAQIEKFLRELPIIDLIFFNQNSSTMSSGSFTGKEIKELWTLEKNWGKSYFVSCILPFHIIQTLNPKMHQDTKVVWMLSAYSYAHPNNQHIGFADYIGNKYQNYLIMKNFSLANNASFFGINPEQSQDLENDVKITQLVDILTTGKNLNGRVFYLDGKEDTNFNIFNRQ